MPPPYDTPDTAFPIFGFSGGGIFGNDSTDLCAADPCWCDQDGQPSSLGSIAARKAMWFVFKSGPGFGEGGFASIQAFEHPDLDCFDIARDVGMIDPWISAGYFDDNDTSASYHELFYGSADPGSSPSAWNGCTLPMPEGRFIYAAVFPSGGGRARAGALGKNGLAEVDFAIIATAPVANDQTFSTPMGVPITDVLDGTNTAASIGGSDCGSTALPATFSILTPPTHGTVVIIDANNGDFRYTPGTGYIGSDSFTWRITDHDYGAAHDDATVTIGATTTTASLAGVNFRTA